MKWLKRDSFNKMSLIDYDMLAEQYVDGDVVTEKVKDPIVAMEEDAKELCPPVPILEVIQLQARLLAHLRRHLETYKEATEWKLYYRIDLEKALILCKTFLKFFDDPHAEMFDELATDARQATLAEGFVKMRGQGPRTWVFNVQLADQEEGEEPKAVSVSKEQFEILDCWRRNP